MKKFYFLLLNAILVFTATFAQTNTFPSAGNVGIGTTTPIALLDVRGDAFIDDQLEINVTGSKPGLKIYNTGTIDGRATIIYATNKFGNPYQWEVGLSPGGGSNIWGVRNISVTGKPMVWGIDTNNGMFLGENLYSAAGAKFYIKTEGTDASTHALRIDNLNSNNIFEVNDDGSVKISGSVGIGTETNSQYKLAVNGTAIFNKIKVQQYPWADFVFDSSYVLPSLELLDQYISLHKHLPEIPSSKEVAKNGNDLGATQVKLLQKVEELTLYMIEQDKQITSQDKKLATQQKEIDELRSEVKILLSDHKKPNK